MHRALGNNARITKRRLDKEHSPVRAPPKASCIERLLHAAKGRGEIFSRGSRGRTPELLLHFGRNLDSNILPNKSCAGESPDSLIRWFLAQVIITAAAVTSIPTKKRAEES